MKPHGWILIEPDKAQGQTFAPYWVLYEDGKRVREATAAEARQLEAK